MDSPSRSLRPPPALTSESAAAPGADVPGEPRRVARLAGLKALVAGIDARRRGRCGPATVARPDDAPALLPPAWPDSFFEP